METPKNKAGKITEEIMRFFYKNEDVKLETRIYNKIYSHVYQTLVENKVNELDSKSPESV